LIAISIPNTPRPTTSKTSAHAFVEAEDDAAEHGTGQHSTEEEAFFEPVRIETLEQRRTMFEGKSRESV
jgi:hypothetical protein